MKSAVLAAVAPVLFAQAVMTAPDSGEKGNDPKQIYTSLCSRCHGADGAGGSAPDLRCPVLFKAPTDGDFMQLIADGIPGSGMPATQGLSITDLKALVRYVRGFSEVRADPPKGNRFMGEELFREKGKCLDCHMLRGKGGTLGPELTGIGRRRTAAQLRAALLDPAKNIPSDYVRMTASMRDGTKITGVLIAEDTFTIRLRDDRGGLHGIDRSEATIQIDAGKSLMPGLRGTFTDAELDNLIAYLVSSTGS